MAVHVTQTAIPFLFMRGGTSRGPYFQRADLPEDLDALAKILVGVVGSGHPLNIDGIGGGNAVTTKVAMLSRSPDPWADIDYFFNAQAPIVPEDPIGLGLETAVTGNGAILVSPNKTTFTCGEQLTLTAQPGSGWQFAGWGGAASGTSSPTTITYDLEAEATADFIRVYQQFMPLIVKE